jgi:hypothetical protein
MTRTYQRRENEMLCMGNVLRQQPHHGRSFAFDKRDVAPAGSHARLDHVVVSVPV